MHTFHRRKTQREGSSNRKIEHVMLPPDSLQGFACSDPSAVWSMNRRATRFLPPSLLMATGKARRIARSFVHSISGDRLTGSSTRNDLSKPTFLHAERSALSCANLPQFIPISSIRLWLYEFTHIYWLWVSTPRDEVQLVLLKVDRKNAFRYTSCTLLLELFQSLKVHS